MKHDLLGKKLVVTGAARGIGEKVARLAAARGARVTVIGLEAGRLRALAEQLGPAAAWREADVRDGAALRSAIDEAADVMGGIDPSQLVFVRENGAWRLAHHHSGPVYAIGS